MNCKPNTSNNNSGKDVILPPEKKDDKQIKYKSNSRGRRFKYNYPGSISNYQNSQNSEYYSIVKRIFRIFCNHSQFILIRHLFYNLEFHNNPPFIIMVYIRSSLIAFGSLLSTVFNGYFYSICILNY